MSLPWPLHCRAGECDHRPMVKMIRITLMLLAALFLARGPAAYGSQPAHDHIHASHAAMTLHRGHAPINVYQGEKQCSKAGCALASCQMQISAVAILPDCRPADPNMSSPAYAVPGEVSFSSLRNGPPSPPPKSPIRHLQAA